MRIALSLALCLVLAALAAPASAKDAPVSLGAAVKNFKAAMKSKISDERTLAFRHLRDVRDPEVMNVIVDGVETLKKARKKIGKLQIEAEHEYEKQIKAQIALDKRWESSRKTAPDMKAYNKREKRISRARDVAFQRLHTLENDFTRNEGMIQSASSVAAHIIGALDGETRKTAATKLGNRWLESSNATDAVRWIYAVWAIEDEWIGERLHQLLNSAERPTPVRTAALSALTSRADPKIVRRAEEILKASAEEFTLVAGAVRALRRMHQRSSIVPLIKFLKREDLKRLRGDAHLALKSLTGQKHGPYESPWAQWWEASQGTFKMPTAPSSARELNAPKEGVTFYGVHTFSDRILFIVDFSGSMSHGQKKGAAKSKMDIVREELIGAVLSLDEKAKFGLIFFNHEILVWEEAEGIHEASELKKKKVAAWITDDVHEVGGTNLFDSLERGFQLAEASKARPALDTIYFLTDGKPTAGKFQDPKRILKLVREWNATALLKIHVIGIGEDHDVAFCKELAEIGDGQYVKR